MAMVRPLAIAMERKAALTYIRSGRPKEMLDRPQTVARPKSFLQWEKVAIQSSAADGAAPTVATKASTTMSSGLKHALSA